MKLIINNKKVNHDYFILDTYEAGIQLKGTEIKSIRLGKSNINDAYAKIKKGECILYNMHISKYEMGNIFNHDERRDRKLLLHKKEILKLSNKLKLEESLTLIPTKLYFIGGLCKIEIALCKGKKLYDKREDQKKKTQKEQIKKYL